MLSIHKKLLLLCVLAGMLVLFITSPFFYQYRSYFIMVPYSHYHYRMSLAARTNLTVNIPAGRSTKKADWYPWMLYYHDTGFSRVEQMPYDLTVLYTFGHFPKKQSGSSYYDSDSPYFGSFYGAYLLRHQDEENVPFGFCENGKVRPADWIRIPKYDQKYLVMPPLGLSPAEVVFKTADIQINESVEYAYYQNWVQMDTVIITNSPDHEVVESRQGYLQYGLPVQKFKNTEFEEVTMVGRIYARHFDHSNLTIGLYMIAPNLKTLEMIDKEYLSETQINRLIF